MDKSGHRRNIIEYFKKNIAKGYTTESLKWALIEQGYSKVLVDSALEDANKELAAKAPILKDKPLINYQLVDEKDQPIILKKPWWKRIFGL